MKYPSLQLKERFLVSKQRTVIKMRSKVQKRTFKEVSLAKWIPHADDNIEDPGATIVNFDKLKGQKLSEVEKKHLRLFKKNYRDGGRGSPRKTEEVRSHLVFVL